MNGPLDLHFDAFDVSPFKLEQPKCQITAVGWCVEHKVATTAAITDSVHMAYICITHWRKFAKFARKKSTEWAIISKLENCPHDMSPPYFLGLRHTHCVKRFEIRAAVNTTQWQSKRYLQINLHTHTSTKRQTMLMCATHTHTNHKVDLANSTQK